MKPDPQALLGALSAIGVEPSRALMVGDTDVDVAAAREVGARVVLVRTGLWETCVREPDAFVDDLCDLPGLLTASESG
jgi:phosphoglycolate phosphatase